MLILLSEGQLEILTEDNTLLLKLKSAEPDQLRLRVARIQNLRATIFFF